MSVRFRVGWFRAAAVVAAGVVMGSPGNGAPVNHATIVLHPAYPAKAAGQARVQSGYGGIAPGVPVYPGVLQIVPGDTWSNYLGAAADGVAYTVSSVSLKRIRPAQTTCAAAFPSGTTTQTSTMRLRWPLLYEPAGARWELTIVYLTTALYDDDGTGPNPPSNIHTEKWTWLLASDCRDVLLVLQLFRDIDGNGKGTPLLSDSAATQLMPLGEQALAAEHLGDTQTARLRLQQMSQIVASGCAGGGLTQTGEHPACCKLRTDLAYALSQLPPPPETGAAQ